MKVVENSAREKTAAGPRRAKTVDHPPGVLFDRRSVRFIVRGVAR